MGDRGEGGEKREGWDKGKSIGLKGAGELTEGYKREGAEGERGGGGTQ